MLKAEKLNKLKKKKKRRQEEEEKNYFMADDERTEAKLKWKAWKSSFFCVHAILLKCQEQA